MRRRQLLARVNLLLQKEEEQLYEELRVVERQRPHLEGNVLRGQAREELLVVGVGDGEIKLQLLEELLVSPRGHNNDGEENGHDVQRVGVAVIVPEVLLHRPVAREQLVQRFQQTAFHHEAIDGAIGRNTAQKVEYHLLEEQLQLLLEVRLQVLRDDDKNRHDIVEDKCVDLLVEEEKRQVAQHRAAHDFEKLGVVG